LSKLIGLIRPDTGYKNKLSVRLNLIKPDITISMYGDEFTFLHRLKDGSLKVAEFHYSRNYLVHLIRNIPGIRFRQLRLILASWLQYKKRKYAKQFSKVVLLTHHDKRLWGNKPFLKVIPNPVSFKTNKTALLQNKQIITAGRLIAQKGFDLLIESFNLIAKENPEWKILILGEGHDKEYLLGLINKHDLTDRIYIRPPQKNIQDFLLESSIFALSSRYEGFGLVLTEAMECGLPCVAFDCECGPSEIIRHREDGFLIENGNIVQFAEHLEILMNDEQLRKKMGITGRQNVNRFYAESVMNEWVKLFSDLLENKS
jgi:glycosyltransferase involved in cell wall biosynthesis